MNKLLIVLLAICLVSAHAFVKRDAPAAAAKPQTDMQDIINQITALGTQLSEKAKEIIDPAKVQEGVQKAYNDFKQSVETLVASVSTTPKPQ